MKTILITTLFVCISFSFVCETFSQWENIGFAGNPTVLTLASSGSNLLAGTQCNGIYVSSDGGANWTQTFISYKTVYSIAAKGNYVFVATDTTGVYYSTNYGMNWTQTSLNNQTVSALAADANNIYAGVGFIGVFISTNNGANWTQTSLNDKYVISIAISGNNIYAGIWGDGVYLSTNNGNVWTKTSLSYNYINTVAARGNYVYAGSGFGVHVSTDNGTNWMGPFINDKVVLGLAVDSNNVFAGTDFYGVYKSNDAGQNWMQRNENLLNIRVWSLFISGGYIYAGCYTSAGASTVWKRELSDIISVNNLSKLVPEKYSLEQNYPNPFNPVTAINFNIPKEEFVTLKIYDILGREVQILVNEKLSAGYYNVKWDASGFVSGTYFCKMTTNNFSDVKRMILAK
ncbi:MAG: T9SS type A sorting domain-containing protein [Ignavibacteria bacterium]|nr:T9SS type A sorting domain-containing protein [Ignavibacteria bacterium]